MARRVFFSFHYERDIWRANVVRNSWVCHDDRDSAGFFDASLWEEAKGQGADAVKRLINRGLHNTSVTAVLIGSETASRDYVRYEIKRSYEVGNGIVGIFIDHIADRSNRRDPRGANPLDFVRLNDNGRLTPLSRLYPTYDWVHDDGFANVGDWVEDAARGAERS